MHIYICKSFYNLENLKNICYHINIMHVYIYALGILLLKFLVIICILFYFHHHISQSIRLDSLSPFFQSPFSYLSSTFSSSSYSSCSCFCCFEMGFYFVALVNIKITIQITFVLNLPQQFFCFCLPSVGKEPSCTDSFLFSILMFWMS